MLSSVVKSGVLKVFDIDRDAKFDARVDLLTGMNQSDIGPVAYVPLWCATGTSTASEREEKVLCAVALVRLYCWVVRM